jgi:hypothetical protein
MKSAGHGHGHGNTAAVHGATLPVKSEPEADQPTDGECARRRAVSVAAGVRQESAPMSWSDA